MTKPLNLISDEFTQNVHQHFAWMRENAPVYKGKLIFGKDVYLITRYNDVMDAFKDPRLVKNAGNATGKDGKRADAWMPRILHALQNNMLNTDDPDHRRLRNLVHKAFTPRMIQQLEPKIEQIAEELLNQVAGEMELVEQFALPLPVTVIAEMVGIPVEDRPKFLGWVNRILVSFSAFGMIRMIPAAISLMRYTRKLADKRRVDPRDDLLTSLVQAEDEGNSFSEDEVLAMVFLLITAGYETTVSLITNGTNALLQNPLQFERLKADHELLPTAIEELLRYDSPLVTTEMSYARETYTLHGVTIERGSTVLPAIGSANRDETVFDRPNDLDLTRQPNKHLAFGQGIHYCLGAPLARLEAKIAFRHLLERCPNMRLAIAPTDIRYRNIPVIHRINRLPVAW